MLNKILASISSSLLLLGSCGLSDDDDGVGAIDIEQVNQPLSVPAGFNPISTGNCVTVYRKDYAGGKPDFVTIADLRCASIKNLNGTPSGTAGASKIARKWLDSFWSDAVAGNVVGGKKARVVINGTFFSTTESPTPIAYGLKTGGTTLNYGYGSNDYPGFLRILMFDSSAGTCSILNYVQSTFNSSTPDGAGIVDPGANFAGAQNSWIARTLVGVADQNSDGVTETVLIYSSLLATQASAKAVLVSFGAQKVGMLDGGGSSGLIVDGVTQVTPGRTVPHAIAIYGNK